MLKLATKFAPLQKNFELAWEAGYRHAEFWLDRAILREYEEVLDLARDYPFQYVLHAPNQLDLDSGSLRNLALLYQGTNSRCLVIHNQQYAEYSRELSGYFPEMRFAVENHVFTPLQFDQWQNSYTHLTLDVEHLWLFTLQSGPLDELVRKVREFLLRSGEKLLHLHLPGFVPENIEHRPMYCNRDLVFAMFDLLQEFQFEGLVVSEIELAFQNPQDLLMDRLLFDRWRAIRQSQQKSRDHHH